MDRPDFTATCWDRMKALYLAAPDLQATCLSLQEDHDVDVVMALFLLLTDRAGLSPTDPGRQALAEAVEPWRARVVRPLRGVRQWQKTQDQTEEEAALREQVKALELRAERLQLARLCALFETLDAVAPEGGAARAYLNEKGASETLARRFLGA